jgi:hypothetical protein
MILNPNGSNQDAINDSKKISELRKLTYITKHQENTWIPIAQYNSRTDEYHNAAINLQAITSYNMAYTVQEIQRVMGEEWVDLLAIGNAHRENNQDLSSYIHKSSIADAIVGYTFGYTLSMFEWQDITGRE